MDTKRKVIFYIVLSINIAAAAVGLYSFKGQLALVPVKLWLFVPDVPLFVLFFVIAAAGIYSGKRSGTFELITWLGLIKYSSWTVFTALLAAVSANSLKVSDVLTIALHIALFLEGLILTVYLNISLRNLLLTAIIFLTADFADWCTPVNMFAENLGIYPRLPQPFHYQIVRTESWVSTFGLLGIAVFYHIMQKRIQNNKSNHSDKDL